MFEQGDSSPSSCLVPVFLKVRTAARDFPPPSRCARFVTLDFRSTPSRIFINSRYLAAFCGASPGLFLVRHCASDCHRKSTGLSQQTARIPVAHSDSSHH